MGVGEASGQRRGGRKLVLLNGEMTGERSAEKKSDEPTAQGLGSASG